MTACLCYGSLTSLNYLAFLDYLSTSRRNSIGIYFRSSLSIYGNIPITCIYCPTIVGRNTRI